MGTPKLQQVLNTQLVQHIKESLPELRNQLQVRGIPGMWAGTRITNVD